MTINRRRLERLEAQIPELRPWHFNVTDLAINWGPMSDEEAEYLSALTLEGLARMCRHLSNLPLDELEKLGEKYAICRMHHYARAAFIRARAYTDSVRQRAAAASE